MSRYLCDIPMLLSSQSVPRNTFWEKELCYSRLMRQLYQSIDSIHCHNKLYSEIIYIIMVIDVIVVKMVIIIYGGGVDN